MMSNLNTISRFFYKPDWGLLFMRITLGVIFVHHGLMKIGNIAGTMHFMSMIGLPAFCAYLIIIVEVVGGGMLILGLLTRVAAVATGIAMVVAYFLAVVPSRGFWGGELEALLAIVSFSIALIGAGKYRLLHMFEHDKEMRAEPTPQGSSL